MGEGVKEWFNARVVPHLQFRKDEDGAVARRALVTGTLTQDQQNEISDGLPEGTEEMMHGWHRKEIK